MSRARSILVPFGTRPEVVKLAPVAALLAAGHRVSVVDTGQHTDPALSSQLQAALGLTPDHRFSLPTDPAERSGALYGDAARAVARSAPDLVLALGTRTPCRHMPWPHVLPGYPSRTSRPGCAA